jgi:hypothetical protein
LDLTRIVHYLSHPSLHPAGEQPPVEDQGSPQGVSLDSFAGPVHVEWDTEAALTPLGQLPFFIDFLKAAGLFDALVADCPLHYASPNAPKKRDVLGTTMLSILSGHKRYAHIAALRCDSVLPELLGMNKIVSEDALRRAFAAIDEDQGAAWVRRHFDYCTAPSPVRKSTVRDQSGASARHKRTTPRSRRADRGFVADYNYRLYHENLDYLTPADVYFGNVQTIYSRKDQAADHRQSFLASSLADRITSRTGRAKASPNFKSQKA